MVCCLHLEDASQTQHIHRFDERDPASGMTILKSRFKIIFLSPIAQITVWRITILDL